MKGVDFSLSFFFAKDGEMIAEVANSLRAMVKIIDAIIYSHLGMSDVIHDLSRKDETDQSTLPDRMSIAEASEESKAGVSLLSWDSAQGIS